MYGASYHSTQRLLAGGVSHLVAFVLENSRPDVPDLQAFGQRIRR